MTAPDPLPLEPRQLQQACDPEKFGFQTAAELEGPTERIGQKRALDAARKLPGLRRGAHRYAVGL